MYDKRWRKQEMSESPLFALCYLCGSPFTSRILRCRTHFRLATLLTPPFRTGYRPLHLLDFAVRRPAFALGCGMRVLHWISLGRGYELTGEGVYIAYSCIRSATSVAKVPLETVHGKIRQIVADKRLLWRRRQAAWGGKHVWGNVAPANTR